MNMMLYRTSAAVGPVPMRLAGRYPSSVSEKAKLYGSGKNALAFHSWLGSVSRMWPAQAISQDCRVGSQMSAGMVVEGCRAHGQVMITARASAPKAARVHSWIEN